MITGENVLLLLAWTAAEQEELLDPALIPDDGRVIGLTVHRTDKLKSDTWMAHPLVRVSLVDLDTETYLKKQHTCVFMLAV